jgi:predicted nucleic acid-binding protein
MTRYLLDSSFVIDLLNEIDNGEVGCAVTWLQSRPRASLWISAVTLAEVLEGAHDSEWAAIYLGRFSWQGIHRRHAERAAVRQKRSPARFGENDAWQVAVADCMDATLVGHDRAFTVLGPRYIDHRRTLH